VNPLLVLARLDPAIEGAGQRAEPWLWITGVKPGDDKESIWRLVMHPILIAGPAVEPVSVDEMRAFLRLDEAAEDELVATLITAACHCIEAASGRILIAQSWRIALDSWPHDHVVALPLSPLIAVESVRVLDAAGPPILLATAHYRVHPASDPPRIIIDTTAVDPGRALQGIELDVRVGYGDDSVPAPLRQAIRMLAARWFEHRGDEPDDALPPPDILALIAPFRRARL
jgi:uncharacterized phiE125 gp8 family phage protein